VEVHDPATDSWTTKTPMPTARARAAAGVINGLIYVAGGYTWPGFSSKLEVYNPALDQWTTKASMLDRVEAPGAALDTKLYAFGGNYHGTVEPYVQAYDATTNGWRYVQRMPTGRMSEGVAVAEGEIYTIGGNRHTGTPVGTVEVYSPASNSWRSAPSMPTTRRYLGAATVNGLIYAVGGVTHSNEAYHAVSTVEIHDPKTGLWTPGPAMLTNRIDMAVCAVNNTLFAFGGTPSATSNEILSSVEALVLLPTAPTVKAVRETNGPLVLTWNAVLGQVYQVQYTTSLSQTNWINLTSSISMTNTTMSVSDLIGPDQQRFYRVKVGP